MSLGQTIRDLRNQRKMSQSDLAEVLAVSRQSISKWETDSSVPEIDKLVRMSELFGVTLDELIKGKLPDGPGEKSQAASEKETKRKEGGGAAHRTAGVILLCFGALITLLFFLLPGGLGGLLFALPFLLCGVICLAVHRRAGLWCAWGSYLCVDLYLRYATGITWQIIFLTIGYQPEWNYVRLATGWGQFLAAVILILCTLRSFRTVEISRGQRVTPIVCGWVLLAGLSFLQGWLIGYLHSLPVEQVGYIWYYLIRCGGDYLRLALLVTLLVLSLAFLRRSRK
ncbi:MAG: helix-turn-helix domain-containing protein [Intestinimonas sp.]|jgi:transcriptional regulator with XRE-family HTH domain|nr:helix-turn-helix domain-containing protein [Intestinimonas sp.]